MIRTNDLWLQKITIIEHGFLISKGSLVPKGIPLAGSSPFHQATEDEGDLGLSEEGFGVFNQVDPSEDPSGDLSDPDLSKAELLSVGTSSQAEMGVKRKPSTSLFDLLEGQLGNLPGCSHNLPDPKFLPLPNPLCLLSLSPPTQRGRGVPRVRSQWTGGNPTPFERKTKSLELKNS